MLVTEIEVELENVEEIVSARRETETLLFVGDDESFNTSGDVDEERTILLLMMKMLSTLISVTPAAKITKFTELRLGNDETKICSNLQSLTIICEMLEKVDEDTNLSAVIDEVAEAPTVITDTFSKETNRNCSNDALATPAMRRASAETAVFARSTTTFLIVKASKLTLS